MDLSNNWFTQSVKWAFSAVGLLGGWAERGRAGGGNRRADGWVGVRRAVGGGWATLYGFQGSWHVTLVFSGSRKHLAWACGSFAYTWCSMP